MSIYPEGNYSTADVAATINGVLAPTMVAEVKDVILWRHRWRKIASWSEALAHIGIMASSIFAFAAGFFGDFTALTFAAACCSTISLALLRFATYAEAECRERNDILNRLLATLGIAAQPGIDAAVDTPRAIQDLDQQLIAKIGCILYSRGGYDFIAN